jgi:cation diffusion facilitator family transporter
MFITLLVNLFVAIYEYRQGKALTSDILVADSMHTRSDILVSLSVIVALVAAKLGYPIIDTLGAIAIALFIAYTAVEILREGSRVLCDTAVIDIKAIEKVVKAVDGVIGCHKIRTRGRQDDIHIDLHVLLKKDTHIDAAHKISYNIEEAIKKQFPGVTDIVVHLEPLTASGKK